MEIQFQQQQPDSYKFMAMPPVPNHGRKASKFRGTNKKSSSSKNCKYVGVRQRPSGRWVAEIKDTTQKIRMWLGTFETPEDAARAYDEAACLLRGSNTRTNFDTTPNFVSHNSPLASRIKNLLNKRKNAAASSRAIRSTTTTSINSTNDSNSQTDRCTSNDINNTSSSNGSGGSYSSGPVVVVDQKGQYAHLFGYEYNPDLGYCNITNENNSSYYCSSIGADIYSLSPSTSSSGGDFVDQKENHMRLFRDFACNKPDPSRNWSGSITEEELETSSRGGIEFLCHKGEEDWQLFDSACKPDLSNCIGTHEEEFNTSSEDDKRGNFADQKWQDSHVFDKAYEADLSHCISKCQSSLSWWGLQLHQVLLQQQEGGLDNKNRFEMPVKMEANSGAAEMFLLEFERMK